MAEKEEPAAAAEKEEPAGVAADLSFVTYDQAVKFHGMMSAIMLSDQQGVDNKCHHVVPLSP